MRLPGFLQNMAIRLGLPPLLSGKANSVADVQQAAPNQDRYMGNIDSALHFQDRRIATLFEGSSAIKKTDIDFICRRFERSLYDSQLERAQYVIALNHLVRRHKDPQIRQYAEQQLQSIAEPIPGANIVLTELRDILRAEVRTEARDFTRINELIVLLDKFLKSPADVIVLMRDPEPLIRALYLQHMRGSEDAFPEELLTLFWNHQSSLIEADIKSQDKRIVSDALINLSFFASYGLQSARDQLMAIKQNDIRPWCRHFAGNLVA